MTTWDKGDEVAEAAAEYIVEPAYAHMSVEEYMRLEETTDVRHEYINGVRYAMPFPTLRHQRIIGNLHVAFHTHLKGTSCTPYMAGLKVRLEISSADVFYCPDLMVMCGREGMESNYLRYPKIVVEVLSRSTQSIDRREKLLSYMQVPTIEEYVMISQSRCQLTIHRRADRFVGKSIEAPETLVEFRSIELSVPLSEIYEGVEIDYAPRGLAE